MTATFLTLTGALLLALVHAVAGRLRSLDVIPRSRWLSFASGMSVAYVFLHLLPELRGIYDVMRESMPGMLGFVEHPVYFVAMLGLATFYGLERLAVRDRMGAGQEDEELTREAAGRPTSEGVFWVHMGAFGIYNALIGYVLAEEAEEPLRFALFLLAMLLHFFVNDYGLRQHHKRAYDRRGRWVLVAAVLAGAFAGLSLTLPEAYLVVPLAFIAGGVILNVLKEELPEHRQSRFYAFALGLAAYSALLLSL